MADFKTALKALGQGRLQPDMLRQQISKFISGRPALAETMLRQVRQAFEQQDIGRELHDLLSSHINSLIVVKAGYHPDDSTEPPPRRTAQPPQKAPAMIGEDEASAKMNAAVNATPRSTNMERRQANGGGERADPGAASGAGDVLKDRFKLLSVLGKGGMGRVYKGIDLLKEEAKDKNPYVAIKLLNENFQKHPEAFIALQRESSRQQKLAHPNIATVHDFDRVGSTGTQVFITMELMEGEPLNAMIRNKIRPNGGMPFEEAFPIIQGLGNALIYAHNRKIVHSDFKPGNCFLCKDGTAKVLDFGVARAMKNPQAGEGEKTLFDPRNLGALTPAYASLEMLEGNDPDPRDDIYALGCVAYELLTGKHPYKKTPANAARDKKMSPPAVKGLKDEQNRALARSVAFTREDRSPNVSSLLAGLEGKLQLNDLRPATHNPRQGSGSGKAVNATFMFADLSGSAKLFEALGDDAARRVVARVIVDITNVVRNHKGRVVKTIGDEVMCVYLEPGRAVQAASAIHETMQDKLYSNQQVKMRVGVHHGTAMMESSQGKTDFFGDGVNVAARMVAQAKGDQTIVSQDVVDKLPPDMQELCRFVDNAHIKGKHDPMKIHEVVWQEEDVTSMAFPAASVAVPQSSGTMSVSYGDKTLEVSRDKPSIVMGRSNNCDVPVNEELASRNHVLLELRRDKFFLIDQSTNGTYVLNAANNQSAFLRREEMMLTGSGQISLGRAFDDGQVEAVQYSHSGSGS